MQEVVLFYNGLDVPTRQILDSRGAIPSKTAADAKTISTSVETDKPSIRRIDARQYAETNGVKDLDAYYTNAKPLGKALPRKEKDSGSLWIRRIPVYGYDDLAKNKSTMLVKYLQSRNLEVLES
ncbi:hypothetical protein Tco_0472686 [Tanacetum coccineum]